MKSIFLHQFFITGVADDGHFLEKTLEFSMRPGDLAHVVIPIPSIFEPIHGDPVKVIKSGDLVLLLKNEPTGWYLPCWQVLFEDQVGILASRWIRPYKPACCEYLPGEDDRDRR